MVIKLQHPLWGQLITAKFVHNENDNATHRIDYGCIIWWNGVADADNFPSTNSCMQICKRWMFDFKVATWWNRTLIWTTIQRSMFFHCWGVCVQMEHSILHIENMYFANCSNSLFLMAHPRRGVHNSPYSIFDHEGVHMAQSAVREVCWVLHKLCSLKCIVDRTLS